MIVLGCRVKGKSPSKFLYDRCKTAAVYLKENPTATAILSGGKGKGEDISEAECMKEILLRKGIEERRLIPEDKSTSTAENIAFSKEIIKQKNLSENVLIVTNEFHEYRAKLICEKNKMNFHSFSCSTSFLAFLTYFTREIFAVFKTICTKGKQ